MSYDYDRRVAARPIPVDKSALARLAKTLARTLPRHLRFKPDQMDDPLKYARGFTANWGFDLGDYMTTDVRGRPVEVPIQVRAKPGESGMGSPRQYIAGGSVKSRHQGLKGRGTPYLLTININSMRSPNELLDRLKHVEKEAFSVLIHEVTHLRDIIRVSPQSEDADEEAVAKDYYNKPIEVRAFMQQIADEALTEGERLAKSIGVGDWGVNLDRDFMDKVLDYSKTWHRVKDYLNPRNRQIILKGVTRALSDVWPKWAEKYPD